MDDKDYGACTAVELCQAVKVNEEIKKVVRISSEVNMAALNAMLIAKRSGRASLGFGVVSSELRMFSRKLDGMMGRLADVVFELVRDIAEQRKLVRSRAILLRAAGEAPAGTLDAVLARVEQEVGAIAATIAQNKQRLLVHLELAKKLCEMGSAISRSAKIEAAYGGAFTASLRQVSSGIEGTVEAILLTLKSLRARVAE